MVGLICLHYEGIVYMTVLGHEGVATADWLAQASLDWTMTILPPREQAFKQADL